MSLQVDISRVRVTHPDGIVSPGRFIFRDGVAAVWVSQRRPKSAERVLYATGASYVKGPTARTPNILTVGDQEWSIVQLAGGCGCNSRNEALHGISVEQLLDPDFSSVS